MKEAGADPTAIVGSRINQVGSNALVGESKYFIIEADEYQNKFLNYNPMAVVLTSLDFDHPDFFKDFTAYKKAFVDFVRKIPAHGFLVAWGGSNSTLEVAQKANCEVILYDFFSNEKKEEIEKMFGKKMAKTSFFEVPSELKLKVPGRHNLLNAGAVLAVCQKLKISQKEAKKALENYQGTARRFEKLGEYQGALVVDDYAHHPEEIKATLKAAREKYPKKRIVCVFHPHTFSRTEALLSEFSRSFDNCDELIVLDVYGSAREKEGRVGSAELVKEISKLRPNVFYLPKIKEAVSFLEKRLGEGDLLLTMGAGNVNEVDKPCLKKRRRKHREKDKKIFQKMKQKFLLNSKKETQKLAQKIAKKVQNNEWPALVLLEGSLGAGKTFLAGEILNFLGAEGPFISPTFLIMKEYILPRPKNKTEREKAKTGNEREKEIKRREFEKAYHLDCYRIEGEKDILDLGWEEIVAEEKNLILVEWPEKIAKIIPSNWLRISLKRAGKNKRVAEVSFSKKSNK